MITYYSADYILPMSRPKMLGGVVAIDENGMVQGVYQQMDEHLKDKDIISFRGALLPGFVNAHCHLELSHMKGKIDQGTGLPVFLNTVMSQRGERDESVLECMKEADRDMYARGIQAVGDHVNTTISAHTKKESKMHYHTFVEMLGLSEEGVLERVARAKELANSYGRDRCTITPHAPYSCSKRFLMSLEGEIDPSNTLSIHNQESDEENRLFESKEGGFIEFYKNNNLPHAHVEASGKRSLQTYIPWLPKVNELLLVHNTFTSAEDLVFMREIGREAYYCLCPKANLYIEGVLPPVRALVESGQKILVGTDSLASNDTLDVLEELKVLSEAFPDLSVEQLLSWATINGADALGLTNTVGSLEPGKTPGLILLEGMQGWQFTPETSVRRIV